MLPSIEVSDASTNSTLEPYAREFQRVKRRKENIRLNFDANNEETYNEVLTLHELKDS